MSDVISSDQGFTADQRRLLASLLGVMIPADKGRNLIAASDDAIVESAIALLLPHRSAIITLLEQLGEEPALWLERLNETVPAGPLLKSAVIQAYYQNERVVAALGMGEGPPFPRGNKTPQGDWSILEKVRQKGKIYREV